MCSLSIDSDSKIRDSITRLLSQREHSVDEMQQKLLQRGFDKTRVEHYIQLFKREGLLSDERFAEAYVRSRVSKGYGPLYIEQALIAKHVSSDQVSLALDNFDGWNVLASNVREKRFGVETPRDFKERARQMRFLQQRGFGFEHIKYAVGEDD